MRRLSLAAVTAMAVLAALAGAPSALAAPQLTLEQTACSPRNSDYTFTFSLSGFPANSQFGVTLQSESGGIGPVFMRTDSQGAFGPFPAFGSPRGHSDVEVFLDANENESRDPGEQVLTASLQGCPEVIWGGTVKGGGDSILEDERGSQQPFHFEVDARSGLRAENPSGTVVERIAGTEVRGRVTCLRVEGQTASMGVALENPLPGMASGQLWSFWDPPDTFPVFKGGLIRARAVDGAPTECGTPSGGGYEVLNGKIEVQQAGEDTAPPTIQVPEDFAVNATSPSGARAFYRDRLGVTDDIDLDPALECSPATGTVFPIGTTIVHCTARDDAGHTTTADFPVKVKGGAEQLSDLQALLGTLGVEAGSARRLGNLTGDAKAAIEAGRTRKACGSLTEAAREIRRRAGGRLTPLQAGRLDYEVARIRSVVGCTPPAPPATQPRIVLAPVCDIPNQPYGVTGRLEGFPPNAEVLLRVTLAPIPSGAILGASTDASGSSDDMTYGFAEPLGTVTVSAEVDGTVLATASLANPCLLERRRGSRGASVPPAGR